MGAAYFPFILLTVLLGYVSSSAAATTVAAIALAMANYPAIAIAILATNLALTDTVQALVANALFQFGLEAASPALVGISIVVLASIAFIVPAAVCAVISLFIVWGVNQFASTPCSR